MSSPPYPSPSALPNPRKRPSVSSLSSFQPPSKRVRDQHPLRQYSLPGPIETSNNFQQANGYASAATGSGRVNSPSASAANSTLSQGTGVANTTANTNTGTGTGTGTARPRKNKPGKLGRPKKQSSVVNDGASSTQQSKSRPSAKSQVSGARSGNDNGVNDGDSDEEIASAEDDDDDDEEHETDAVQREETRLNTFLQQLTPEQSRRYYSYKGAKLSANIVRRIINQTVSQSVGKSQVDAVQFFAKAFVMDLLERSREVQSEWARVSADTVEDEVETRRQRVKEKEEELERRDAAGREVDGVQMTDGQRRALLRDLAFARHEVELYVPDKHRGGLLPDHVREALRRYKMDGEGGGVGYEGGSHPLLGTGGSYAWNVGDGGVGKRLFR